MDRSHWELPGKADNGMLMYEPGNLPYSTVQEMISGSRVIGRTKRQVIYPVLFIVLAHPGFSRDDFFGFARMREGSAGQDPGRLAVRK